jgi:hypothetical protein
MTLPGPSRTIVVEPIEAPREVPEPSPCGPEPAGEDPPERSPVPWPTPPARAREREGTPA